MQYSANMQATQTEQEAEGSTASHEIASRIRSARARAGLTRKQLAAASGASERYLAKLEAGLGNPSIEMLMSVADALGLAVADLIPMGGERDRDMAHVAQLMRRMSPERIRSTLDRLGEKSLGSDGKGQRIALIGLRGAGKSSLGKALAKRMNVPFFEISKEIERRYGGAIGVLLEINGPSALGRYEAEVIEEICQNNLSAVIAAPGAIVADGKIYEQLRRSAWTVWLQASPEDHMQRVVAQGDLRPMSGNRAAMADLKSILSAREADYARADSRLDTSAQDFEKTLDLLEGAAFSMRK